MDNAPVPDVLPPHRPAPIALAPRPKPFGVLAWVGVVVGVFLCFLQAWIWSGGVWTAESSGYAMGGVVFVGLIAYAIAGRRKVRNPNRFGFWYWGLALLFYRVEFSHRPPDPKLHVGELFKEAAGTKAIEREGSPMDIVVRDFMRDVLPYKKAYEAKVETFGVEMAKVGSAESFANKAAMQSSIEAVRGIVAADQDYGQQLDNILERVQKKVDATSLTESEKRAFMKGLSGAYGNSKILADRRQVMAAETQWSDATVELYQLGLANSGKIRVKGSQIVINDENLRARFNHQLQEFNRLKESVDKLNTQLEQDRRSAAREVGLTPQDIGAETEKPK